MENQNNDKSKLEAIQQKLREQHLARLTNQKPREDAMLRFSGPGTVRLRVVPGIAAPHMDLFPSRDTITVMGQRYVVPNNPLLHQYITEQRIRLFYKAGKERSTRQEKAAFDAAKGMFIKERWLAPVVERGRESQGVRVWSLSQKLYAQIFGFYADPAAHTFLDPGTGRDLNVSVKPGSFASAAVHYPDSAVLAPEASPLCDDAETAEEWLRYVAAMDIDRVIASWIAPEADIRAAVAYAVENGGVEANRLPDRRFEDISNQLDRDLEGLIAD